MIYFLGAESNRLLKNNDRNEKNDRNDRSEEMIEMKKL